MASGCRASSACRTTAPGTGAAHSAPSACTGSATRAGCGCTWSGASVGHRSTERRRSRPPAAHEVDDVWRCEASAMRVSLICGSFVMFLSSVLSAS